MLSITGWRLPRLEFIPQLEPHVWIGLDFLFNHLIKWQTRDLDCGSGHRIFGRRWDVNDIAPLFLSRRSQALIQGVADNYHWNSLASSSTISPDPQPCLPLMPRSIAYKTTSLNLWIPSKDQSADLETPSRQLEGNQGGLVLHPSRCRCQYSPHPPNDGQQQREPLRHHLPTSAAPPCVTNAHCRTPRLLQA